MKRLTRAAGNVDAIGDALKGVSADGREILKQLENMKFKTMQCTRLTSNNDHVSKKVMQNADLIDKVMSTLYSVCFNIDNVDLTPLYDNEQLKLNGDDHFDLNREMPEAERPKTELVEDERTDADKTKSMDKDDKKQNESVDEQPVDDEAQDVPADESVDDQE